MLRSGVCLFNSSKVNRSLAVQLLCIILRNVSEMVNNRNCTLCSKHEDQLLTGAIIVVFSQRYFHSLEAQLSSLLFHTPAFLELSTTLLQFKSAVVSESRLYGQTILLENLSYLQESHWFSWSRFSWCFSWCFSWF